MKKQLHEKMIEFFMGVMPRYKEEFTERERQKDKVIVWLTAISTGAIALILSQSDKLHIANPVYLKISVALLLAAIICGVIFRIFFYQLEELWAKSFYILMVIVLVMLLMFLVR